jgi:hypothetical protein
MLPIELTKLAERLTRQLSSKHQRTGSVYLEKEDIQQELALALLRIQHHYPMDRITDRLIAKSLCNAVKELKRREYAHYTPPVDWNEIIDQEREHCRPLWQPTMSQDTKAQLIAEAKSAMPKDTHTAIDLITAKCSVQYVSEALHCSVTWLRERLSRLSLLAD